jgi:nucleotide-binding universal stress UspA family protein
VEPSGLRRRRGLFPRSGAAGPAQRRGQDGRNGPGRRLEAGRPAGARQEWPQRFAGLLIGSIALAAAARAHCPVAVVGGSAAARPEAPVVVGVDGSAESDAALGYAFEEANARGVPLVAVHAWSDVVLDPRLMLLLDWVTVEKSAHAFLADRLAGWTGKFPDVDVRTSVVRDRPASALVERSTNAQLLVVGSRGRGGVAGLLLGSVSRAVLPHAHSPVVLVPTGLDAASDSDGGAAG